MKTYPHPAACGRHPLPRAGDGRAFPSPACGRRWPLSARPDEGRRTTLVENYSTFGGPQELRSTSRGGNRSRRPDGGLSPPTWSSRAAIAVRVMSSIGWAISVGRGRMMSAQSKSSTPMKDSVFRAARLEVGQRADHPDGHEVAQRHERGRRRGRTQPAPRLLAGLLRGEPGEADLDRRRARARAP